MAVAMARGLLDVTLHINCKPLSRDFPVIAVSVTAKRQLQNMVQFDVPIISKHIQSSSQAGLFEYNH